MINLISHIYNKMKIPKKHKKLYIADLIKASLLLVCFVVLFFIQGCNVSHRKPTKEMKKTESGMTEGEMGREMASAEKKEKQSERKFIIEEWKETTPEELNHSNSKKAPNEPEIFLPGHSSRSESMLPTPSEIQGGNEENIWEKHHNKELKEARKKKDEALKRYKSLTGSEGEEVRKKALRELKEASLILKKLEEKGKIKKY